jgi:hypothetical protein
MTAKPAYGLLRTVVGLTGLPVIVLAGAFGSHVLLFVGPLLAGLSFVLPDD